MCGVIGLFDNKNVVSKMYSSMLTIQHRGQDSAGILTYNGTFHLKKGNGLIRDIFDQKNIARLQGNIGIGHTRYPTVGEGSVEDAQPFWLNFPFGIAGAHNGNITNFFQLKKELNDKSKKIINSNCDMEVVLNVFAEYIEKYKNKTITPEIIFNAVKYVYKRVKGSYAVVLYIAGIGMLGFRDPYGLRPLLFGKKQAELTNEKPIYGFASESTSLSVLNFDLIRDVEPGSAIFINEDKEIFERKLSNKPHRPCIFEYIYFARPDSDLNGINVYSSRVELGNSLAKKIKKLNLDIDIVSPVPDSARTASIAIARKLKLKYREGLVKNRYIGRTFIMPEDNARKESINQKLNPIGAVFKDKNVLLVDDSIVRGNTSKAIVQMVKNTGAKKIFFASYSSPLTNPCFYGIDMQTKGEFIALNSTEEEIAKKIGADLVIYQDIKDMESSVRTQNKQIKSFCKACFTGDYPTGDITEDMLGQIENDRANNVKSKLNNKNK